MVGEYLSSGGETPNIVNESEMGDLAMYEGYAQFYDLIYKDKDYAREARKVDSLIDQYLGSKTNVLDLGCGTGRHAIALANFNYEVLGVDVSSNMIGIAKERKNSAKDVTTKKVTFQLGDIRSLRINNYFGVVLSLFHVLCYQVEDADLHAAFKTISRHLKPNGLAIFDVWYGPAVRKDPPKEAIKRVQNAKTQLVRIAEPVVDHEKHLVNVKYQLFFRPNSVSHWSSICEDHRVRYLFDEEVRRLTREAYLEIIEVFDWDTGQSVTGDRWNVWYVCRKCDD